MIGALGPTGTSDNGLLARLGDNGTAVRAQLDAALLQQSSGLVSDSYSGLGTGLRTSLDLRPAAQHAAVWQQNIDLATTRLDVTQSAMKQVSAIAADFFGKVNAINDIGASEVGSVAASARQALGQVAQLLNTRDGDTYVFAGQDSANPPVPNTDPDAVGAALLASDTATAPFSATLGTAVPQVEVGDGQTVQVGLLANANTLTASAPPTTGSYMRDLMRSLATLAQLVPGPGAQAVAAATRTRLSGAIDAMAVETGALGTAEATLQARKATIASVQISLNKQVSGAEDVDLAAVLSKVSLLQTQLKASYQVVAGVKELSLTNFI